MDGGPLEHCDGLANSGPALYIAVNARNLIAVAGSADDGSVGRVHTALGSKALAFPSAVALGGGRLLVVNSQLNAMGGQPGCRVPLSPLLSRKRVMKMLAVGCLRDDAGADEIARYAREEMRALWQLSRGEVVREMYSPGRPGAVLVLEAPSPDG